MTVCVWAGGWDNTFFIPLRKGGCYGGANNAAVA